MALGAGRSSMEGACRYPGSAVLTAAAALIILCGLGRIFHLMVVPTDSAAAAGIYVMRKIPSPLSLAWGYPAPEDMTRSEAPQRGDLMMV